MRLRALILLILLPAPLWVSARSDGGVLTGGLESNTIAYRGGDVCSNNYLKLDYINGRFSAGLQAEYYPEPLLGYDQDLKGFGVPWKYLSWTGKRWGLTVGDFYEQLGTGVLLRSWEDRTLGWNNSLGGARVTYTAPGEHLALKVLGGWRRQYLRYSGDRLAAADAVLAFGAFTLEGSAVVKDTGGPSPEFSYGVLPMLSLGDFYIRGEWVGRNNGNAQTLELLYAPKSFSSSLTVRRLQNMEDPMGMNYLPSLCQQQTYMLATLNPYTTFAAGELGGSADIFYSLKSWKFHANGSMIYALPSALRNYDVLRMAYRDINIEVERRWNRRFKTVAYVSIQENSPSHGDRKATNAQNVFVLDGVYRTKGKLSLRMQAQYLYSQELTKDWCAALAELSSTAGWGVHVQDMYNHGSTGEHYYEAGVAWSRGSFKADLSYGHQRAGFVCSGGVCRWQPEYTGGMLRLNYLF